MRKAPEQLDRQQLQFEQFIRGVLGDFGQRTSENTGQTSKVLEQASSEEQRIVKGNADLCDRRETDIKACVVVHKIEKRAGEVVPTHLLDSCAVSVLIETTSTLSQARDSTRERTTPNSSFSLCSAALHRVGGNYPRQRPSQITGCNGRDGLLGTTTTAGTDEANTLSSQLVDENFRCLTRCSRRLVGTVSL
ncbi:hypothetical protein HPB51_004727 [Rhipicephalus microplus]|uniref:Uncharacterized protein n=1 Tax=Rhipicephalus microplus TaxID=6941 RepID=A0A9J6DYR5_RHIMP|nr:hypothetical protein HPB51_004727 [Rhipicephalus microplus]